MKKIIKILKHIFIPHEHNDFKPGFFREASVVIIVALILFLLAVSAGTKIYINKNNMKAAVLPAVLVDLTNNVRKTSGEGLLARNPTLDKAAQMKANDMATNGYFAHTSPEGITPWYWFSKAGYHFVYAGENLAVDFSESNAVENAWLNSPTHRANIMNKNFSEIGIATAEGYYNGRYTTFVVQEFGKPISFSDKKDNIVASVVNIEGNNTKINNKKDSLISENKDKNIVNNKAVQKTKVTEENSNVKGESVVVDNNNLETITNTDKFIAVKNLSANQNDNIQNDNNTNKKYSTWAERLIFLAPHYTDLAYKIIIYIVVAALILMTVIEIKRQHTKNIIYGVLLIIIILCLIYINKTIFFLDFLI